MNTVTDLSMVTKVTQVSITIAEQTLWVPVYEALQISRELGAQCRIGPKIIDEHGTTRDMEIHERREFHEALQR